MLNKELLMIGDQSSRPVYVTLYVYKGLHSYVAYAWTSPDGTHKQGMVFVGDQDVSKTLTCKPNTPVSIEIEDNSCDYRATPPQDITVVEQPSGQVFTFTAFRDVVVYLMPYA